MNIFTICFKITLAVFLGALGVLCALCVAKVAIAVAGVLLGSTLGTLIFALLIYAIVKCLFGD